MRNKFASVLNERLDNEYRRGFNGACLLLLIAYYNRVEKYIPDEEKQGCFAREWEAELNRIIHEECKDNILDSAEIASYHIEKIRERFGMEELD